MVFRPFLVLPLVFALATSLGSFFFVPLDDFEDLRRSRRLALSDILIFQPHQSR